MIANKKSLSWFKYEYGLRLLGLYGIFFSLNDLPYLNLMYSCTSYLNLCTIEMMDGLMSSSLLIYGIHLLRLTAYIAIFFRYKIRYAASIVLICGSYFMMLNQLVYSPDIPYIHFLLFTVLLSKKDDLFFKDVFTPFSIVVYLSYSFSGFYKLMTPLWFNGNFLSAFLSQNHLVHPWAEFIAVSPILLTFGTYIALYSEVLAALAIFNRVLRTVIWFGILGIHLSMLLLANIPEVSLGILAVHLFLLDDKTYQLITAGARRLRRRPHPSCP